ncbi:MAG: histidinol-phosphate transaminase, partial [Gaiellaceae bacterium]
MATIPPADVRLRPAVEGLVPYEPGKPAEELQRELGLSTIVKLASNEGPHGPFPAAKEALAAGVHELNRYPDGGVYRLREALARRHRVEQDNVVVAAGADAVIGYLSLALLEPGDEIVCGWPSFPSYVIDARKLGAEPVLVPLADDRYDLEALVKAVTDRTRLVFVCNPNNPTGTMVGRRALDAYFETVPDHVLTVLDEAYWEYVEENDYPDGIEEYVRGGRKALALRTFSKIYGLAGLRVGYGVGAADVIAAVRRVQNAFDVTQPAQDAALASLDDTAELKRRRSENTVARARLLDGLEALELKPAGPCVANFVYVDVAQDAGVVFDRLLHRGVIVRPMAAFGAASAI